VDVDRRHRWIRGDWQIARWLLPQVPGAEDRRVANPLSMLSQCKILDNLRRSLVPIALMFLILGAWGFLPQVGGLGCLLVLVIITLPGLLSALADVFRKPAHLPWVIHLSAAAASYARHLGQNFLTLAFLPYEAFISLDAVGRTLLRLLVTHKRLLEWHTSSDSEGKTCADLAGFYATMWIEPVVALAIGLFLAITQPVRPRRGSLGGSASPLSSRLWI